MKKFFPKLLAIGIVSIILGSIVFVVGLAAAGWDIKAISGITVNEHTYEEVGSVQKLSVSLDTADLTVVFDEDADKISVVYYTEKNKKDKPVSDITVTEEGGTLSITQKTFWTRALFLFNFEKPKVTVTVPKERTTTLKLETDTGDIKLLGDARLISSSIEADTGDIFVEKFDTDSLMLETDTGKITLNDGYASGKIGIKVNTGDVKLLGDVTADRVEVVTDTGDLKIYGKLTATALNIKSDTGYVECERDGVIDAVRITVTVDSGDVEITLFGAQTDYQALIKTDTGDSNISSNLTGARVFNFESDAGDLTVHFTEK